MSSLTPHTDALRAHNSAGIKPANAMERITVETIQAVSCAVAREADCGVAPDQLALGYFLAAKNVLANASMSIGGGDKSAAIKIAAEIANEAVAQIMKADGSDIVSVVDNSGEAH